MWENEGTGTKLKKKEFAGGLIHSSLNTGANLKNTSDSSFLSVWATTAIAIATLTWKLWVEFELSELAGQSERMDSAATRTDEVSPLALLVAIDGEEEAPVEEAELEALARHPRLRQVLVEIRVDFEGIAWWSSGVFVARNIVMLKDLLHGVREVGGSNLLTEVRSLAIEVSNIIL